MLGLKRQRRKTATRYFWSFRSPLSVQKPLLKWKPLEDNTIDFAVKADDLDPHTASEEAAVVPLYIVITSPGA
jgi:hypothetical protein